MIISAITLMAGIIFIVISLIYGNNMLGIIPSITIIILGIVNLVKSRMHNCYVITINDFNGKEVFRVFKAKKYYKNKKEGAGYYLKINGFKKHYKYPERQFVNFNTTNNMPFLVYFYQENDQLSPIQTKYELDNIKFISSTLIANKYQMDNIIEETTKPPADNLQTILNVAMIGLLILTILSNIYLAGKNGVNMGLLNSVVDKIDNLFDSMNELMLRLQGGVINVAGIVNNTASNVPPIIG